MTFENQKQAVLVAENHQVENVPLDLLIADLVAPIRRPEESQSLRIERMHVTVAYFNADQLLKYQSAQWTKEATLDEPLSPAGLLQATWLLVSGFIQHTLIAGAAISAPRRHVPQTLVWH